MFQSISLWLAQSEPIKEKPELPTLEEIVILVAILVSLLLVAIYVVGIFRGNALGKNEETFNHLDDFRKLHEEGVLEESEFKKVKSQLIEDQREKIDFREDRSDDVEDDDRS